MCLNALKQGEMMILNEASIDSPTYFSTLVHQLPFCSYSSNQILTRPYFKQTHLVTPYRLYVYQSAGKHKIQLIEASYITLFIVRYYIMVNEILLSINRFSHPHPKHFIFIFIVPKTTKRFDFNFQYHTPCHIDTLFLNFYHTKFQILL